MASSWFVESPIVETSCKTKCFASKESESESSTEFPRFEISQLMRSCFFSFFLSLCGKRRLTIKTANWLRRGTNSWLRWLSEPVLCAIHDHEILSQQLEFLFVPLNASFFLFSMCRKHFYCTNARAHASGHLLSVANAFVCVIEEFIPRAINCETGICIYFEVFRLSRTRIASLPRHRVCADREPSAAADEKPYNYTSFRMSHVPLHEAACATLNLVRIVQRAGDCMHLDANYQHLCVFISQAARKKLHKRKKRSHRKRKEKT